MKTISCFHVLAASVGVLCSAIAADETPPPPTPTNNPALAGDSLQVGVARRDGITFSGGEVFVTRNGATEKLTKELQLPSGVIARPDGTVILADNTQTALRVTQLLTFQGKIVEIPSDPNVNPAPQPPAPPTSVVVTVSEDTLAASTPPAAIRNAGAHGSGTTPHGVSTVFLGGDGIPFMGVMNPNGTIATADGRIIAAESSLRAVTFAADGTPALGTINANGTITRADGATIFPDGSVRSANGTVISPARVGNSVSIGGRNHNGAQTPNNTETGQNTGGPNTNRNQTEQNANGNPNNPKEGNGAGATTNKNTTRGAAGNARDGAAAGGVGTTSGSARETK